MIERGTTIIKIMDLIEREKQNARRYCEINPADAERRKHAEQLVIGAYLEILYMLTE